LKIDKIYPNYPTKYIPFIKNKDKQPPASILSIFTAQEIEKQLKKNNKNAIKASQINEYIKNIITLKKEFYDLYDKLLQIMLNQELYEKNLQRRAWEEIQKEKLKKKLNKQLSIKSQEIIDLSCKINEVIIMCENNSMDTKNNDVNKFLADLKELCLTTPDNIDYSIYDNYVEDEKSENCKTKKTLHILQKTKVQSKTKPIIKNRPKAAKSINKLKAKFKRA
jgi:hypothetical protein